MIGLRRPPHGNGDGGGRHMEYRMGLGRRRSEDPALAMGPWT